MSKSIGFVDLASEYVTKHLVLQSKEAEIN